MGIERLIKDGWFNKVSGEFDLPLTKEQAESIKRGEEVVIEKDNKSFVVYIRQNSNPTNLKESDIVIREIPVAARSAEV